RPHLRRPRGPDAPGADRGPARRGFQDHRPRRAVPADLRRGLPARRRPRGGGAGAARDTRTRALDRAAAGRPGDRGAMDPRADRVLVGAGRRPRGPLGAQAEDDRGMSDSSPVVVVRRTLPAPPDAVYDEWLDPEALTEWMCPRPARCLAVTLDPRVG